MNFSKRYENLELMSTASSAAFSQARAEDFQIGEALIFPARGAREKFLSATPKFLSATPIFGF